MKASASTGADLVETGKPYCLLAQNKDNPGGVTFEVYNNWDHALLTNDPNYNGTAVGFEKKGNGYSITSVTAHWRDYRTWCGDSNGIVLARPSDCASVWHLEPTRGSFTIRLNHWSVYNAKPMNEFTVFKAVPAE